MNSQAAENKKAFEIIGSRRETGGITTVVLRQKDAGMFVFKSGQFLTVYFPDIGTVEGKAYSISSAPSEQNIALSVHAIGAYSNRLASLSAGDVLYASGPYGFFYSEEDTTPLVLVAGGIGVAPFRSMIVDALATNQHRPIRLFYSVKHAEDAAFLDLFSALAEQHDTFSFIVHVTQEACVGGFIQGRMTSGELLLPYKEDRSTEFMICGSIAFVRELWKGLKEGGVPEDQLYTEAFF
jgi:ferredoxin-NADP reductase